MEKVKKATKQEYDRLAEALVEYNKLADAGRKDAAAVENALQEYMEQELRCDFDNEIVTSDDGLRGLALCYGEVVIPCRYEEILWHTSSGVPRDAIVAIASREDRDVLVNSRGEEVFSADEIRPGVGTIAPVTFREGDRWGIAGRDGRVIVPAAYDSVSPDENGYWWLTLGGKEGFVDGSWRVVEPVFDSIESEPDEWLRVTMDGKKGYVDADGAFAEDEERAFYNMFY